MAAKQVSLHPQSSGDILLSLWDGLLLHLGRTHSFHLNPPGSGAVLCRVSQVTFDPALEPGDMGDIVSVKHASVLGYSYTLGVVS